MVAFEYAQNLITEKDMNIDKDNNPTDGRGEWKQFLCRACGWIYDEKLGDPDGGLPAGTRYEDIPEDWQCPLCGVTKRDFELFIPRSINIVKPQINPISNTGGLVVIGAGLAGWAVIEAVRALDADYPITLITADSGNRYHKPQLSIAISQSKNAENLITQLATVESERLNIGLVANTFVMHIDTVNKQVRTTRGDFNYDSLVFAIGAKPVLPKSLLPKFVWRINHVDMFAKLQQKLAVKPNQLVAIIGAGMIGSEFAEDIVKAGHQVILIDRNALPLAEILPTKASQMVKDALVRTNINFLGNNTVSSIDKNENGQYEIHFADKDKTITVDEVVASTGLMVDGRLPNRAGIRFAPQQGIIVDNQTLQTSQADVYAIGDCMAIDGQACRFVAPIRQQADTIAHQVLTLDSEGYSHQTPVVRLKTKSVAVTVTGSPCRNSHWETIVDDGKTLIMQQAIEAGNGRVEIVADINFSL